MMPIHLRALSRRQFLLRSLAGGAALALHPSVLAGEKGLEALASVVRAGFDLGAIQFQFNTVDRRLLEEARAKPDEHRSLVVRVSGFSSHFVSLDRAVQEDILARTEHR